MTHSAEGDRETSGGVLILSGASRELAGRWPWPVHRLKSGQPFYDAVATGAKPFECRRDDRRYAVNDLLILCEWTGERFTGRDCARQVTYVLRGGRFGVEPGWVVLGLGAR